MAFRISGNEIAFPLSADLPRQLHFTEIPGSCLSRRIFSPLQGWQGFSACTLEPRGEETTTAALQSLH